MGSVAWWFAVAMTIVCSGCAPVLPGIPGQGGAPWTELTSEHFTVWTDAAPGDGRALVRKLERFRRIVAGVAFPAAPARGRSLVIALRDEQELRAFGPHGEPRAFAIPAQAPLWQPIIVLSLGDVWESQTAAHELAHLISYAEIRYQPRWLAEGIAQFFETVAFGEDSSTVDIGSPPVSRREKLPRPVRITELFTWRGVRKNAVEYPLYRTAWLFVTFLLNEHPAELSRYLQLLDDLGGTATNPSAEQVQLAWDQAFPALPASAAYWAMREWLLHGRHTVLPVHVNPSEVLPIAERRLNDADVHAIRAWSRGAPHEKAQGRVELAASLAAEPTNVLAHVLRLFEGGTMLTADAGRAIATAHPDDWRAWWLATIALTAARGDAAEIAEARARACARIADNPALIAPHGLCPGRAASSASR